MISDLQAEIKTIKANIKHLKFDREKDSQIIQTLVSHLANQANAENDQIDDTETQVPDNNLESLEKLSDSFLFMLKEITSHKYLIQVTLVFQNGFSIDTLSLFDIGADINCIKSGLVPRHLRESTSEKLSTANNSRMKLEGKIDVIILNQGVSITTSFVFAPDMHHSVILGTPFINLITLYHRIR